MKNISNSTPGYVPVYLFWTSVLMTLLLSVLPFTLLSVKLIYKRCTIMEFCYPLLIIEHIVCLVLNMSWENCSFVLWIFPRTGFLGTNLYNFLKAYSVLILCINPQLCYTSHLLFIILSNTATHNVDENAWHLMSTEEMNLIYIYLCLLIPFKTSQTFDAPSHATISNLFSNFCLGFSTSCIATDRINFLSLRRKILKWKLLGNWRNY